MADDQKTKMTLLELLEKKCRETKVPTLREFLEERLGVKTYLYGPRDYRNDGDFYFYVYEGITEAEIVKIVGDYHTDICGQIPAQVKISVDWIDFCVKECGLVVIGPLYAMWNEEFDAERYYSSLQKKVA
ncbi:hypothetical protein KJ603_00455 [Patescibacteria group bacterium]|nr:hypothetical protein [Patescibacteria group bacterium]